MGKRGQKALEERIGIEKFKELLKRLSIPDIAKLYCEHEVEEEKRARCKACIRAIYRTKKRIEEKEKAERRFEPMEEFEVIPEIQAFIEYQRSKKTKYERWCRILKEYWIWIKENPELAQLSRPALWDERHIKHILQKLHERNIALYHPKQALRRFFESQGNYELQKHVLIKARREDMRSPNGARRKEMEFAPCEVPKIRECLDFEEKLAVDLHITVKSREGDRGKGSLLNIQWKDINWQDTYYEEPMATIDVYEPKTKGGTWWRHCPVDLWFGDLSWRLYKKWERLGKPKEGYVLNFTYHEYLKIWQKISKHIGRKLEPHDCRRSAGGWLRDLGCSELALGHYNPTTGEAIGYTGVGWENAEIYYQRYGKRNPKTIYTKELRLHTRVLLN